MSTSVKILCVGLWSLTVSGCSTVYEAKPLPVQLPSAMKSVVSIESVQMGARAFMGEQEAKEVFGFDILGAGLLPVQVTFDNQGMHSLAIKSSQTFLISADGAMWPLLERKVVLERASKYAESKDIISSGAYKGVLGAAAGGIIGAAVGVASGKSVAQAAGKGAALGAAAGMTVGGVEGYTEGDSKNRIQEDIARKSLENKPIPMHELTYGFLFFPAEAKTAKQLRMQLQDVQAKTQHTVVVDL